MLDKLCQWSHSNPGVEMAAEFPLESQWRWPQISDMPIASDKAPGHPSSLFTERIKMCKGRTHSKGRDSRADEYNNYEFVYTGKVILLYWKQNLTNLTTGPYVRREVGNFPELWWCSCLSQNHVEALGRWRELAVWGLLAIRIACVTNYPKTPLDNHFILLVILWFVNLGRIVLGHSCSVL